MSKSKQAAERESPQVADAKDREALDALELAGKHLWTALRACQARGIRVEWGYLSPADGARAVPEKLVTKFSELYLGDVGLAMQATKQFRFVTTSEFDPEVTGERTW